MASIRKRNNRWQVQVRSRISVSPKAFIANPMLRNGPSNPDAVRAMAEPWTAAHESQTY